MDDREKKEEEIAKVAALIEKKRIEEEVKMIEKLKKVELKNLKNVR